MKVHFPIFFPNLQVYLQKNPLTISSFALSTPPKGMSPKLNLQFNKS